VLGPLGDARYHPAESSAKSGSRVGGPLDAPAPMNSNHRDADAVGITGRAAAQWKLTGLCPVRVLVLASTTPTPISVLARVSAHMQRASWERRLRPSATSSLISGVRSTGSPMQTVFTLQTDPNARTLIEGGLDLSGPKA
jgi:hypothetical protein